LELIGAMAQARFDGIIFITAGYSPIPHSFSAIIISISM
jgi:hypothetical protein